MKAEKHINIPETSNEMVRKRKKVPLNQIEFILEMQTKSNLLQVKFQNNRIDNKMIDLYIPKFSKEFYLLVR